MAEISSLLTLQGQLALLTLIGFFLARKGIINAQGRKCLTDLLINVILPANIIQSFLVEFSWDVLKSSASILVISLALQIGCVVLCALGYNWLPFAKRSVYQYGTVCSNGAFLGSALVDGIWGSSGLLLSSIYLIPQRVAMWSVGVSYFLQDEKPASKEEMRADRRAVLRKTFTHPCILAVVVGMVLMASQLPLPGFLGRTVKSLSNCNMGVSMILIGAIIGSSRMGKLWDKDCFLYCLIRLGLIPAAVLLGAKGEMLEYAVRYGRVLMVSVPTFILQNLFQSFFVTAEKPKLGFLFTVGAGCTNMVLDVVMVGMLHWGVEGAAVATLISQLVGGVLPVFYFIDHHNTSRLHLCRTQFYGRVLWDACINGSSELMTNLSMSLVNILYNFQLLRLAGENGVAAYGVIMYAAFLFVAVFVGYAVGSAPIVSFHYGARNHAEVHNLYQKSLRLIAVVAVTMTAASMVIIPYVARIFVGYDAQLLALTSRAFRLYALSFLIMGFNVYASSFFTALGDGVTSALISFLRTLVFQLAALLLLPALWGIDGVWLAVTAAELAALAVSVYMFVTKDQTFHYRHG